MSAARGRAGRIAWSWLLPLGLFVLALVIRLVVASQLPFPTTEPSAYFLGVAANLVAGDGLVSDAVWSYATEPLVVPKPAFELWLPMSSFISALVMSLLGPSFWAAQVGGALVGALAAPLAWAIAREAADAQGLAGRRGAAVAVASGLLVAALAPLLLAAAVPDSYTPFLVSMLLAALLIPRVLGIRAGRDATPAPRPSLAAGLGLGVALGLAYLSRQEVIWLGATYLLMLWWVARKRPPATRAQDALARLWPVVLGGSLVVLPWLVRNHLVFGSPLPGQAVENAFLVRNEDIFAFTQRPDLATYLDQGLPTVLSNPFVAAGHGLLSVILVTAFPVGVAGLMALWGLRRAPAVRRPTALVALLLSGGLTFVATCLLFPVASRWGTFAHASGPLLVALTVMAALGGDALLARVSAWRRWERPNVILAPIALLAVTGLLATYQVLVFAEQARTTEGRITQVARGAEDYAMQQGLEVPETIITDHPMWLAAALERYAVVLPHEDVSSIIALSRRFEAPWLVLVDEGDTYPAALLTDAGRACLARDPVRLASGGAEGWLFMLDPTCAAT